MAETAVQALIDELRKRPGSGESIPIIDPVTEEPIAEFVDAGANAIDAAVARARATFESGVWHRKPGTQRAQVLWRVAELLEARTEELAQVDSLPKDQRDQVRGKNAERIFKL